MRTARFILASGILALNTLRPVGFAQTPSTDLILFNGKVFTSNASQPYVEALAIRGDRIVAVGTSKEVVALASRETRRLDLGGRTVIPGINDAHMHLGIEPSHFDLPLKSDDPTWQEMTDALTAAAPKVDPNFGVLQLFCMSFVIFSCTSLRSFTFGSIVCPSIRLFQMLNSFSTLAYRDPYGLPSGAALANSS